MAKAKQLLDTRTLQRVLQMSNLYSGKIDGVDGPRTYAACIALLEKHKLHTAGWSPERIRTATEQAALQGLGFKPGTIDGYVGPQTLDAQERYQNTIRDVEPPFQNVAHQPTRWPRERDVPEFYGPVGQNQVALVLPFTMRLAWAPQTQVTRIQCHKLVHDSLLSIFTKAFDHYGADVIQRLRLDMFGGCLNVRAKKGGKAYSMHSWGIAVDLDPDHNQLRWGKDKAQLDNREYDPFWQIVESEGWISLGREKNFDWMHFQAARF